MPGGREFDTERRLRECLSGHFAVMNVSGAQTVLELSGPAARAVLMKSTPYDVHPRNFPVGKGVSSVFAKSGAVIRRVAEERWELVIRRSFADYLFRWVLDASEGNVIQGGPTSRLDIPNVSPGDGFESRAFGPFLVVRTTAPVRSPEAFLRATVRVQQLGEDLRIETASLNYHTAAVALATLADVERPLAAGR